MAPFALAAALAAAACDKGAPAAPRPPVAASAAAAPAAAAPAAAPMPARTAVSFRGEVLPYLLRNCASSDGCHGPDPTDSVALDLRPQAAWRELVNHDAAARKGALRVRPGDPAQSFLVDKLVGRLRRGEGKAMPLDPDTGVPSPPTSDQRTFVETVLVPWVAGGAPDN